MKKLLILIASLILSTSVFAGQKIIVINKSTKYDMTLSYKICDGGVKETCPNDEKTLVIKAKTSDDAKNYEFIFVADSLPNPYMLLRFNGAQEKDQNGNVVAEGRFNNIDGTNYIYIRPSTAVIKDTKALILDDEGTPYIFWTLRFPTQIDQTK